MTTNTRRSFTFQNGNDQQCGRVDDNWTLTTKSTIIINENGYGTTLTSTKDSKKRHIENRHNSDTDDETDVLVMNGDNGKCNGNTRTDKVDGRFMKPFKTENDIAKLRKPANSLYPVKGGKHRKLVIHFDIRNTVLVADSVTNVSVEQALNSFLTGVAWGRQCSTGDWEWHTHSPSLTPPNSDVITYYKHLEKQLIRTPSVRAKLRLATGEFTEQDIGEGFQEYFRKHLQLLQWKHPKNPGYEKLTMAGKDGTPYHYILPSVYRAIHWLKQNKRDFAIIFRTYGLDANNVLASLAYGLSGNHPDFPKIQIKVNQHPGKIKRSDDGSPIVFDTFNEITGGLSRRVKGDREGYTMMSEASGISAYVDDFPHWQSRHYHHTAGKPFYVDLHDTETQHIIFDDNFRSFEDDSIVDVKVFESKESEKARSLSKSEVAPYQKTCLVQANLLDSIQNENYFTDAIQLCERNYNRMLSEKAATVKKRKLSV